MSKFLREGRKWYQQPIFYAGSVLVAVFVYFVLPKSLFHSFNCNPGKVPTITRTNYQATNGFFIDNQVIVIGPEKEVNEIIGDPENPGQVGTAGVLLDLVEGCKLSYLNTRKFEQVTSPSAVQTPELTKSLYTRSDLEPEQRKSLVMRLYEVPRGSITTTEFVVSQINDTGKTVVYADPNYIVSLLDEEAGLCGRPYAGGGSPYAGGGSPYAGGGSTSAGPGISRNDVSDQFMQQWAFHQRGINLPPSSNLNGFGVRVGVFDTSPFRKTYLWFPRTIQVAQSTPLRLAPRNAMGPDPISNHGLFVSGLIHAIAPNSRIELIRVLNDNGCGNLWEIDTALQAFTSRRSAWSGKLNKVVINLSLGVHIPDQGHADDAQNSSGDQHVDWDQIQRDLDKLHAFSFEETLSNAYDLGAVIVAAAGNDSVPSLENPSLEPQDMQFPANYDDVIGVAATDINGNLACYSNKGNVAAPGGNGGLKPDDDVPGEEDEVEPDDNVPGEEDELEPEYDPSELCVPRAVTWDLSPGPGSTDTMSTPACTDIASCDFGVTSLLIVPDQNGRWKYDYGLWSGTSFSTALVSGLAALAYENAGHNPAQVRCLIEGGGSVKQEGGSSPDPIIGWGIIDIAESLSDSNRSTFLSTCEVSP